MATVNGETLGENDLRIALTAYRRQAIGDLVSQRLVLQEARKRGLDTTVGSFDLPTGLLPDERLAWERQAQASQQRKRVVLSGFTSVEKHRLFESLAPDLHQYSILIIVLSTPEESAPAEAPAKQKASK